MITEALKRLRPGAKFSVNGESYEGVVWLDSSPMPSKEEVEAMAAVISAEMEIKRHNEAIKAEMDANDSKIIRALTENDLVRIDAHKKKQAALRAKLK